MGIVLLVLGVLLLCVFIISKIQNNALWWWVFIPLISGIICIFSGVLLLIFHGVSL